MHKIFISYRQKQKNNTGLAFITITLSLTGSPALQDNTLPERNKFNQINISTNMTTICLVTDHTRSNNYYSINSLIGLQTAEYFIMIPKYF